MSPSRRSILAAGAGLALSACAQAPTRATFGGVRRISPALDAIIPADAVIEELGSGYQWSEGPVWVRDGGYLLFTDVPANIMYKWSEAAGVEEFLNPSGFSGADASHLREGGANGLARAADGAIILCDTGNRNLARLDLATKQKTVLADRHDGRRFNSPNDLAIHSSGAIYFTDPPYGLEGMSASPLREIPFHGVYLYTPDGRVRLVDDQRSFPNGVALSPDEKTLYVACSDEANPLIWAYALGDDGLPLSSRLFFDAKPLQGENAPGLPDGLKVDEAGRLFATGPGGVLILTPEAELLGVIDPGSAVANCGFGEDGATLFITAHNRLGRIRLNTRAARWA